MLQKLKSEKTISYILLFLFLITLIPLFVIARYDHSCADDYSYGLLARQAWTETHSLWAVILAAVEKVSTTYVKWQGTFSSIFLMSIQPSVFGERLYIITPFIMIGSLIFSMFFFLKAVFITYLKANRYQFIAVLSILLFLSIQLIYSPVQAFYWYNGALHYVFMHSLMLIEFGIILYLLKENKKVKKILYTVIASLLGIVIGGGNYITILLTLILFFVCLIAVFIFNKKNITFICIPFLITFVAFIISAVAPGNAFRKSVLGITYSPLQSILYSFKYAVLYLDSFLNLPLIIGILLVIPFLWKIVKNTDYSFKYPGLYIAFSFCLFASSFTPTVYATGGAGLGRTINVMFLFFLLLLFSDILYLLGWYARFLEKNQITINFFTKISVSYFAAAILLMALSCTWLAVNTFTFVSAYYSLATEEAKIYDAEVGKRFTLYGDASIKDVVVEPFSVHPYILYLDDITTQADDITNYDAAMFFNKNSIKLKQ